MTKIFNFALKIKGGGRESVEEVTKCEKKVEKLLKNSR